MIHSGSRQGSRRQKEVARIVCAGVAILALGGCDAAPVDQAESLPHLVAEERLRIGSTDDPETALTSFFALDIGPDGRIYTAHRRDQEVRTHGPDGEPLGAFGREGEGPGEFLSPGWLIVADGEVRVWDVRLLRVSTFDLDGVFLRARRFEPRARTDPRYATVRPRWLLADGTFVDEAPVQSTPEAATLAATPILRLAFDGTVLDTVALRDLTNQHQMVDLGPEPHYDHQPFGDVPFWAVSATALQLVMVDRLIPEGAPHFRVTKLDLSEDTLWTREAPFEPVPLEPSAVDEYVTRRAGNYVTVGLGMQREAEAAVRAELHVPDHLPAASHALVGRDGSVWVRLVDRDPDSATWLSLSSGGDLLGLVELPERFTPLYALEDELWGKDFDELDVPYIVKYEIL